MNDQELDHLITEHFATERATDQDAPSFAHSWAEAERSMSSRKPALAAGAGIRWPRYAMAAAVLLVVFGGVLLNRLSPLSTGESRISAASVPANLLAMQDEVLTTTLWQAPSDRLLDHSPALAGWQLPASKPLL